MTGAQAAAAIGREPLLELGGVTLRFGGVVAVNELDLTVEKNEIFALIGPNGAGKTSVFNIVTGVFEPNQGAVRFGGTSLVGLPPYQIVRLGLARTFQNIRLFGNMSALENVMVGTDARHRTSVPGAVLGLPSHRAEERDGRKVAHQLLDFVGIGRVANETANVTGLSSEESASPQRQLDSVQCRSSSSWTRPIADTATVAWNATETPRAS